MERRARSRGILAGCERVVRRMRRRSPGRTSASQRARRSAVSTNGSAIYVRLWTQIGGAWQFNDYSYAAAGVRTKAAMTSPASGTTLSGSTVTFDVDGGIGRFGLLAGCRYSARSGRLFREKCPGL